jgi:hypothetical protein
VSRSCYSFGMKKILSLFALLVVSTVHAEFSAIVESGGVWQTRNDVGIPSSGGTRFSLSQASSGPFFTYRVYAGYELNERHGFRALFAPLSVSVTGTFNQNIDFAGQTYASGIPLTGTYQFNSYRLTYRYLFYLSDTWKLHVGFTGKIRDAKIAVSQAGVSSQSLNVGFVPLLHFAATYPLSEAWRLVFDFDGLMAPQGRAFDITLQAAWRLSPGWEFSAGYRTVEGGAENSTIFNFTWLHYLVAAVRADF